MSTCYIALGSNLGDPAAQLRSALSALASHAAIELLDCSPGYRCAAVGPGSQPDYINAVAALRTELEPRALLGELQAIETRHGRERGERWAARTLDLDILLYDRIELEEPGLTIPHPRLRQRNFVLYPLADLAPGLTLPCGTALASLLAGCPREGLQAVGDISDRGS